MTVEISNNINDEVHLIEVENYTEAKHWIINHLDLSIKWFATDVSSMNLGGAI